MSRAEGGFRIAAHGYDAVVVDAGGGLASLHHHGVPLVAGFAPGEVASGGCGQVLVPWPNRIRDGAYSFAGREHQLPLSEPARHNASHGLVRWCRWEAREVTEAAVTLGYLLVAQSGYPWSLDVSVTYAVTADGLTVRLSATNMSASPAPFAAGMHPYLDVGGRVDDATLVLPARTRQLVDDRLLPSGTAAPGELDFREGARVAARRLDTAFTDLERDTDGRAVVRLEGERTVELWLDEAWPWVQVYSGDALPTGARESLAVEPMSAPADAFNSGTDLVVLEPGATWSGRFGIRSG